VTLQFECNRCELKGLVYNHQHAKEGATDA